MFKKNDAKFSIARETKKRFFSVDLSKPTGLVYINSMKTHSLQGWWWMVCNAPRIARINRNRLSNTYVNINETRLGVIGRSFFTCVVWICSDEKCPT
jgi:hypothetical protein